MPTSISSPASFSSVRSAFNAEGYGISTSLFAYRKGGGIVPNTSQFNPIGGSPLQLSQFNGFSVPSQAPPVNITDRTLTRQGNGSVAYRLNSDGVLYTQTDTSAYNAVSGEWKVDASASSLYEARMGTLSGSGGTPSGTFDTWLGLGTTREWSLFGEDDFFLREGFLEIRLASTQVVIDSATIQFLIDAFTIPF